MWLPVDVGYRRIALFSFSVIVFLLTSFSCQIPPKYGSWIRIVWHSRTPIVKVSFACLAACIIFSGCLVDCCWLVCCKCKAKVNLQESAQSTLSFSFSGTPPTLHSDFKTQSVVYKYQIPELPIQNQEQLRKREPTLIQLHLQLWQYKETTQSEWTKPSS